MIQPCVQNDSKLILYNLVCDDYKLDKTPIGHRSTTGSLQDTRFARETTAPCYNALSYPHVTAPSIGHSCRESRRGKDEGDARLDHLGNVRDNSKLSGPETTGRR